MKWVWPVLCLLSACSSMTRPAPVVERSPVIAREVIAPKLPSADKKDKEVVATPLPKEPALASDQKKSEELSQATPLNEDDKVSAEVLKLTPLNWTWPLNLPTTGPFSELKKGLDFVGGAGLPVNAAATGTVSYVGSSIKGYGQMVVIRHEGGFITVYANNSKVMVKEGSKVVIGQKIAETGRAEGSEVAMHFELRRQGKPIDPATLFPPRQ